MAKTRTELFALINSNLPDNTSKAITPAKLREVETQNADSALNTSDLTEQVVAGPVSFASALRKGSKDVLVGGAVTEQLRSVSTATQQPSALGTPLQIVFGAASGTPSDPVQLSAAGVLTFNQAGTYAVRVKFQMGRTAGSAVSYVLTRMLRNGQQVGSPDVSAIETANQIYVKESRVSISVAAGDSVFFQVARDPSGANSGGLINFPPTGALASWGVTATALLVVERFTGATS